MLVTALALHRRGNAAWLRAVILMRPAVFFTFWSCAITAIAFTGSRAMVGVFLSIGFCRFGTTPMFIARLALDRRGGTAWFRAVVLMRFAICFTFRSFAIAAVAFASSGAVMGIFFGTAFCHFGSLLGICSCFDRNFFLG